MTKSDKLLQTYVDILNHKVQSTLSIEQIFGMYNDIQTTSKHGLACKTIIEKMALYQINQKLSIEELLIQSKKFTLDKEKTSVNFRSYKHTETGERFIISTNSPYTAISVHNNAIYNPEKFYQQYLNPDISTLISHVYNHQTIAHSFNNVLHPIIFPVTPSDKFMIEDYKIIPIIEENLHYNTFWKHRQIDTNIITDHTFDNIVYLHKKNTNISFIKYLPIGFLFRDEQYQIKQVLFQYPSKNTGYPIYRHFGKGTGKDHSLWQSQRLGEQQNILVVENPLDALSHYLLQDKPSSIVYLATGGEPTPEQYKLIVKMAEKRALHIGFDNDKDGNRFTARLLEYIKNSITKPHTIITAQARAKDFNEDLLAQKGYILNEEKIAIPLIEKKHNIDIKTAIKPISTSMKH